jgi:predicted SprT family Zn-dependent metalloprotease
MKSKKFTYKVDNRMKSMGETDFDKHLIRINKTLHKNQKGSTIMGRKLKRGELLDSIVHEEMHRKHPKMHEKTVYKLTPKTTAKMSKKSKQKMYKKFD